MTRVLPRWIVPALLLLVSLAAGWGLRTGDLAARPLHNDEAINARKLAQLWEGGGYRYDPHEYHGPTLYYLSLPVLRLAAIGRPDQPDEADFRWVPVLAGLGLIVVLLLFADGLGVPAAAAAALLTAVSPAMVYYSRYFIHEPLLVLFTALALGGAWRYSVRPRPGWALLGGAGLGLMWATKETFVFAVAAAGWAWVWAVAGSGSGSGSGTEGGAGGALAGRVRAFGRVLRTLGARPFLLAGLSAAVVGGLFLSSFLAHPGGVWDSLRTYLIWGERAGGATPHVQPWSFYFERLLWFHSRGAPVWSEALILGLALVGGVAGWCSKRPGGADPRLVRFLAAYTVSLAAIYSLIPYKTPWCLLGFLHGALMLAGVGTAVVLGRGAGAGAGAGAGQAMLAVRVVVGLMLSAGVVHLAVQAWKGSREFGADFRNPYVYGHTSADVANLLDLVRELAAVDPGGRDMSVQVVAPESAYWPLPWYLRRFTQVGWYDTLPAPPYASVVVAALKAKPALEESTGQAWRTAGMFELRPRYFVEVYVEAGLWKRFLAARAAAAGREP